MFLPLLSSALKARRAAAPRFSQQQPCLSMSGPPSAAARCDHARPHSDGASAQPLRVALHTARNRGACRATLFGHPYPPGGARTRRGGWLEHAGYSPTPNLRTLVRGTRGEHEMSGFRDAREALVARNEDAVFDIIVCDLMTPAMSGAELQAALNRCALGTVKRLVPYGWRIRSERKAIPGSPRAHRAL